MFVVGRDRLFVGSLHILNPVVKDAKTSFNDMDEEVLTNLGNGLCL